MKTKYIIILWIICIAIGAIAGSIARAELVWDGDYRCLVAECRIIKK